MSINELICQIYLLVPNKNRALFDYEIKSWLIELDAYENDNHNSKVTKEYKKLIKFLNT